MDYILQPFLKRFFSTSGIYMIAASVVLISCGAQMGGYSETDGVYYDPNKDTLPEGVVLNQQGNQVGEVYDYNNTSIIQQSEQNVRQQNMKYEDWNNQTATDSDWGNFAGNEMNYYDNGWYSPWGFGFNNYWGNGFGWNIGFGLGFGWGNNFGWGFNNFYQPWGGWGFGFNNWGWNNPYYGFYNPYWGNNFWYGNNFGGYYGYGNAFRRSGANGRSYNSNGSNGLNRNANLNNGLGNTSNGRYRTNPNINNNGNRNQGVTPGYRTNGNYRNNNNAPRTNQVSPTRSSTPRSTSPSIRSGGSRSSSSGGGFRSSGGSGGFRSGGGRR